MAEEDEFKVSELSAAEKTLDINAEGTPIESAGLWDSLVPSLAFRDKAELEYYIKNNRVLDVGSGMGGLVKEARIRGTSTDIVSLNPRLGALEDHLSDAHSIFQGLATERLEREYGTVDFVDLNETHDKSAVSGFSNNLPFSDQHFDRIIDNKGAIYHILYQDSVVEGFDGDFDMVTSYLPNEEMLQETIREYIRVLKPGGAARVGGLLPQKIESLNLLKKILESENVEYMFLEDENGETIAFEMRRSQ